MWSDVYDVALVNAEGNGNIPARYQDRYQNGSYEVVLVFCDTERKPYEQYDDIKRKINDFHGVDNAADEVVILGNPCTLQIISKHWTSDTIKKATKAANAPLIEKFTGVKGYKGRADQIDKVMESINTYNYVNMRERVLKLSRDDHMNGSSNFCHLVQELETSETQWMTRINSILEGDEG